MASGNEQASRYEALEDKGFSEIVQHGASILIDYEAASDPYQKQFGIPQSWQGSRHHPNGRVEFGDDYEVGRLRIGNNDFELIFAHNTRLNEAELIVHEFAPEGGVASKSTFKEVEGRCRKFWVAGGYNYMEELSGRASGFHRDLEPDESAAVRRAMVSAIKGEDVQPDLEELVRVSDAERSLISKNAEKAEKDRRELIAQWRIIDEMERRAWERSKDILIR